MRKAAYIGGSLLLLLLLAAIFLRPSEPASTQPFSVLLADMRAGSVRRIEINRDRLNVSLHDGTTYESPRPNADLLSLFANFGIDPGGVEIDIQGSQ